LLAPGTPMLFQGQEFWSTAPFQYFADHAHELSARIHEGRLQFMSQFPSARDAAVQQSVRRPNDPQSFVESRLNWSERERNTHALALHRDLITLRRSDLVFSAQRYGGIDGAVIGQEAFVLRYLGRRGDDRLLVVNFGRDLNPRSLAEPLVAPPAAHTWTQIFSSEDPAYGGAGSPPFEAAGGWTIPGHAAIALRAQPLIKPV
jgi:maltooligosyltrehalose trehalohydrolase